MSEPTLEDDEAALRGYADALLAAIEGVLGDWIRASIGDRNPGLRNAPDTDRAAEIGSETLMAELGDVLTRDIADQTIGPLQILRAGTRFASAVLADADTAPAARDAFAQQAFPDDLYDLVPASFADIDPSLHEPGLVWGAAKAHVHLRRRRAGGAT